MTGPPPFLTAAVDDYEAIGEFVRWATSNHRQFNVDHQKHRVPPWIVRWTAAAGLMVQGEGVTFLEALADGLGRQERVSRLLDLEGA